MFIPIAIAIGSAAAAIYESEKAADAGARRLKLQEKERELQMSQKRLSVYEQTRKVLNKQTAQATTRGFTLDSPSFNAIQRQTVNIASKELRNLSTGDLIGKYSSEAEAENVRDAANAQIFGTVSNTATSYASFQQAKPKYPTKSVGA